MKVTLPCAICGCGESYSCECADPNYGYDSTIEDCFCATCQANDANCEFCHGSELRCAQCGNALDILPIDTNA